MKVKNKKSRTWLIVLLCLLITLSVAWILLARFENEKPAVLLEKVPSFIGACQKIAISVSDTKSGVRRIWIGLLKDGREVVLLEENFPSSGLFSGGLVHKKTFNISIKPEKQGISDGKAILRIVVRDFSWRQWWHGNKTYIEKNLTIDTKPPDVDILTRAHNITQGGAGLVIYKTSEPCPKSGIYIGDTFFPGHSGYFKDTNILMAFFVLDYTQGADTKIFVNALDQAGNSTRAGLSYYIKRRAFKKDVINIPDRFLNRKMPEFDVGDSQKDLPKTDLPNTDLIDKFLKVNRDLRLANFKKITEIAKHTDEVLYWKGPFLRLPGSARRAGFADKREYRYKGRIIDRQVHLGIDLASVARSPVPASNKGKVVYAGPIGIYGKTVMIDHGFGIFSMYSHLSGFNVKKGQIVSKGDIIGRTGATGLAAGDHLHFGILIHNTFVNPVEWWDAAWIKNNITAKINAVKAGVNQE